MSDTKVIMPQMGESIFEGTITKWLKNKGDRIERDEPLFEISTDKIDSEIPAPAAGTLKEIIIPEGETVEINTVVALIADSEDESPVVGDEQVDEATQGAADTGGSEREEVGAKVETEGTQDSSVQSSPMVRRMAREHNIDLAELQDKGTGVGGRITKRDIQSYLEQREEEKTAGAKDTAQRVPMTAMRKSIAEHMKDSKRTSAHVATVFEVNCSAILKARTDLKSEFQRSSVTLTVTPFFIHAAVRALKKFPIVNSSVDGDTIVYKKAINIGIAVALEDGLIVPVIRKADDKNLLDLARELADLGERARTKKLLPNEVQDGTFHRHEPRHLRRALRNPHHQPTSGCYTGYWRHRKPRRRSRQRDCGATDGLPRAFFRPSHHRWRLSRPVHGRDQAGTGELEGLNQAIL